MKQDDQDRVSEVLAALADPMRRQVLDLVAARGPVSASALAGELPVSRQAIVKHLAVLERAELVTSRRAGRENCFSVRSDALDATASWMASLASQWDSRLARLKRIAEA
ncbi:metalloregulator ArsR/SmtB family transcription factor [Lentzea sp. NPDC042327]|uniref:ArsR/SmtB family transcription factor n=1 Tax=Lentzea sp. NPDC042327 TaxID=3154801 RepID=UPI00340EFA8D